MRTAFAYLCSLMIHGLFVAAVLWWPLRQTVPSWAPQNDRRLCLEMEAELAARAQAGVESGPEVIAESPRLPDAPAETTEALPKDAPLVLPRLPRRAVPEMIIEDWSPRGDRPARLLSPDSPFRIAAPDRDTPPLLVLRPQGQVVRPTPSDALAGVSAAAALNQPALAGSEVDQLPRIHPTNPKPPYPPQALAEGREGVVSLWATIAADGSVAAVRVYQSSGVPALDASALETVRRKWRFTPARRGNTPVAQEVILPIRFSIRGR